MEEESITQNVLVVAYYFPPMGLSGVQRTLKFVKYLPNFGWNPIVLTTTPKSYYAFDEELIRELVGLNVKVYRTDSDRQKYIKVRKFPSNYTLQKIGRLILNFFFQPDTKIGWKKKAIELGEKIIQENKIDIIFATAPPFTDFLIALELSEKYDIPFVVDYRDVWVDNPYQLYPTFVHKFLSRKLEEKILKNASKIIVSYRGTKDILLTRYQFLRNSDIEIIPHGFDLSDFENAKTVFPDRNKFVVTHSGLFQDNRNPKYFLKAFSYFLKIHNDGIPKEAWFIGIMRKSHLRYIKKYKLESNVKLFGYQPHSEVVRLLMQSDVLWLMQQDTFRSPGKLFEYFGAKRPILACVPDGYIKQMAIDSGIAIGVDPKNVEGIVRALSTFYDFWKNSVKLEPKEGFVDQFDRCKLTERLAKILSFSCNF